MQRSVHCTFLRLHGHLRGKPVFGAARPMVRYPVITCCHQSSIHCPYSVPFGCSKRQDLPGRFQPDRLLSLLATDSMLLRSQDLPVDMWISSHTSLLKSRLSRIKAMSALYRNGSKVEIARMFSCVIPGQLCCSDHFA